MNDAEAMNARAEFIACMRQVAALLGSEELSVAADTGRIKIVYDKTGKPDGRAHEKGTVKIEYEIPQRLKDRFHELRVQKISLRHTDEPISGGESGLRGNAFRVSVTFLSDQGRRVVSRALQGRRSPIVTACEATVSTDGVLPREVKPVLPMDARNTKQAYELIRAYAMKHCPRAGIQLIL